LVIGFGAIGPKYWAGLLARSVGWAGLAGWDTCALAGQRQLPHKEKLRQRHKIWPAFTVSNDSKQQKLAKIINTKLDMNIIESNKRAVV
jgi:hypothetical protein